MWDTGVHRCAGVGSGYGVGDAEFSEVVGEVFDFAVEGRGSGKGEGKAALRLRGVYIIASCMIIGKAVMLNSSSIIE